MSELLTLLLFVLPLGLDTFAIAAAAGTYGLPRCGRYRISAIFTLFEGGTPLIGLGLGSSAGHLAGSLAEYLSGGLLILLGCYLWWSDQDHDEDDEAARAARLIHARGLALLGLALSISVDEFAIGFSFGIGANLATPGVVIAVIAIQAFIVSQLGLSFGARINDVLRERVERLVGPILIIIGLSPLAKALIRIELVPSLGAVIVAVLAAVLAVVSGYWRVMTRTRAVAAIRSGGREAE
ncbi:MAG TPA: manganese efflux pump [Pseudonocardiaceae bacterium]|nr:manganese efflux pump [Pseudonocardiaceae bacterium]